MTGLEQWAAAHQTSAQEISILLETEDPSGWKDFVGPGLDSGEPIASGRSTAMEALLGRGHAGEIDIPLAVAAAHASTTAEEMTRIAPDLIPAGARSIQSHALPALLDRIRLGRDDADRQPAAYDDMPEPAGTGPEKPAPAAAPKAAAQPPKPPKKTKYSVTKSNVSIALGLSRPFLPARGIRAFLLSLPGCKAQDVALMTDGDAEEAVSAKYAALRVGGGTILLPPAMIDELARLLYSGEAYYLPDERPEAAEDRG